jgi:hypothetical protein
MCGIYCNHYGLKCETSPFTKLGSLLSYRILFEVPTCKKGDSFRLKKCCGTQWTVEGLLSFLAL